MEPTIWAALIALIGTACLAGATFIGTLLTLFIGLRGLKIEREKLTAETAKFRIELDETRQRRLAEVTANIEIEKEKGISLLENRKTIYAEMLEVVYRLRNRLRDIEQDPGKPGLLFIPGSLGEGLYLLTENLYKYRAFIDEDTFQMLHLYKRLLQNVEVLANPTTRSLDTEDSDTKKMLQEIYIENIHKTYPEVEKIYNEITHRIQAHIEGALIRKE